MSFRVVQDIRRFACEDSGTVGRDMLRRRLDDFANRVDETIDSIIDSYNQRIAKQAGVLAETADGNVRLKEAVSDLQRRLNVAEAALERIYKCVDNRRGADVALHVKDIIADALYATCGAGAEDRGRHPGGVR